MYAEKEPLYDIRISIHMLRGCFPARVDQRNREHEVDVQETWVDEGCSEISKVEMYSSRRHARKRIRLIYVSSLVWFI